MPSLIDLARERYEDAELAHLSKALEQAERDGRTAAGETRTRGLEAARMLFDMRLDWASVAAALLAGVDRSAGTGQVLPEVLPLLEGVARLDAIRWDRLDDEAAESLRRMFLAMARDVRVVLIVLSLRVEQLRHLEEVPAPERERLAREALEVFAPLANRLGVWQFKWELEDSAFEMLEPENHRRLAELIEQGREGRASFVGEVVHEVTLALERAGIDAKVAGRPKHLYSIYKKMAKKQVDFEQIFDISAVRVITSSVAECYAALGVVHSMWRPIKGEFDDYIAMPKGNGYQSLHTAVVGPRGKPAEVQIRTREMHRFAEFGVAAHWAYKEQRGSVDAQDRFVVLRRLLDWERELEDPKQFVESLQTDIFEDQVLVFTPRGDVIDLPRGSTALDFAYRVHTMVGHRTKGVRVNGQIVPLDVELNTGDRVEVLTHKQPHPSRDWMNPKLGFLKTPSARAKVRHWFREQGRDQAISEGRAMLERELSRLELSKTSPAQIAHALDLEDADALYAALGFGDKSAQAVATVASELDGGGKKEPKSPPLPLREQTALPRGSGGVSLDGVNDVLGQRARCCHPLPGDDVLGFVTRGRGIVIHRRDCNNVRQSPEPERWVKIQWGPDKSESHGVDVLVVAESTSGLLNRIVRLLTHQGVGVSAATLLPSKDASTRLKLTLQTHDAEHLSVALQRVGAQPEVDDVRVLKR
jgi:RelA/SpoT family (p)ppGpp synthetase